MDFDLKPGEFYLGKVLNTTDGKVSDREFMYSSKNLTTHAVCVGMTGSGKTGLGIALLEEAALDRIPAIAIDPKGDLGNLLLTFPHLAAADFKPWVDPLEAEQKGMTPDTFAESLATTWKNGLAEWNEDGLRIQRLRNLTEMTIYTPANDSGIPLSILSSFAAPPEELLMDSSALRDRILALTSSLLSLLGIDADPIKSREQILISTIVENAWTKGKNLDIETIIQQVQNPPFKTVGVLDIETFFPLKERMALSINLNNLLASPGFQAWMKGESLDIQKLLYNNGKTKLSILSIAHLQESERMFFVTLFLNELLTWLRRQPGSSNLRAILYMDEIFGYFPPTAMPPSKLPMLKLLKQARAYGLGIVLATQNPVDLDYKGLSNCGTWFIGKLQTERDRNRVLEGLATASNGEIQSAQLQQMMSLIGKRIFLMRSIYEKEPILFQTRWTMSYLYGPLTLPQITTLMRLQHESKKIDAVATSPKAIQTKPYIPPGISEVYVESPEFEHATHYEPSIFGLAKLHYVDAKAKIDSWQTISLIAPLSSEHEVDWTHAKKIAQGKTLFNTAPKQDATFDTPSNGFLQLKNYEAYAKSLSTFLYQNETLALFQAPELKEMSSPGESREQFEARLEKTLEEKREVVIENTKQRYKKELIALKDKLQRSELKASEKKSEFWTRIFETVLGFVTTIMSALSGRGVSKGTITQAGTSMRRAGRITRQNQAATDAEEDCKSLRDKIDTLEADENNEIKHISDSYQPHSINIETITLRPRKSDISIEKVGLAWKPTSVALLTEF